MHQSLSRIVKAPIPCSGDGGGQSPISCGVPSKVPTGVAAWGAPWHSAEKAEHISNLAEPATQTWCLQRNR